MYPSQAWAISHPLDRFIIIYNGLRCRVNVQPLVSFFGCDVSLTSLGDITSFENDGMFEKECKTEEVDDDLPATQ